MAVGVLDGLNYCIGALTSMATNEIIDKLSEQVNTTNVEQPLQVTTKGLKKVAAGKKLAEWHRKKNKENLAQPNKARPDESQKSKRKGGHYESLRLWIRLYRDEQEVYCLTKISFFSPFLKTVTEAINQG